MRIPKVRSTYGEKNLRAQLKKLGVKRANKFGNRGTAKSVGNVSDGFRRGLPGVLKKGYQ